tara:strand:- start:389 stop:1441 length:1053 start_codon:yes stop_codon:yes gene_type:complete
MSWRTSCVKTCGYCDDPKHNPALGWTYCADENGVCNINGKEIIRYGESISSNYIDKEFGTVGQDTSVNCNNSTFTDPIVGTLKKCWKKPVTDTKIECAAHYGSASPSDGSNSGTVATKYVCPESKPICKDYKFNVRWGYCASENPENIMTNTASIAPMSIETPPAPIENKAMLQQPTIQNADVMVIPTDNSLFNDSIMKQVLENKNVIPSDINLALEKQNNYVRIGKNFMTGVSDVRNIELPHINDDDFESLGRIVAKIKRNVDQDNNSPQNSLYKKELMNSVNYILSGTELKHSNVNWKAPGQAITARTTGMLGDNSNKIINNNGQSNNQQSNNKAEPLPWNATESGNM